MVCRPLADRSSGSSTCWSSSARSCKRREPHIYVANWFYLAFIVTVAMLHIVNNLAVPVSLLGSKSYSLFSGVQDAHDAVVVRPQRGRLLPHRRLPRHDVLLRAEAAERPIYSYRLSIVHFWSLIFLYIWAGPHHLHYTALPDWAQTLGMTFSIMLWMPSWGGMINGLMTLSGAWDKLRTDPVIRMLVVAVAFYGMSTFEGPLMCIKSVNCALALHRLDHRPCAFRRARLGRLHHLRRALLPGAVAVAAASALYSQRLVEWHFWIATLGIVLYITVDVGVGHHAGPDVARLRQPRLPRLLLRRDRRGDASLLCDPGDRRAAVPHRRAAHGLQRLADHSRR